ncbi:MAG: preprotein translocase subunit SecE [Ignavibacteriae bacterium]|nr:preprotein translocase subunit SecE [Ignavibacteriota bacterium]MCB9216271.1 preprotein translocase subunit SecE [Ignavibacteria bacterium]
MSNKAAGFFKEVGNEMKKVSWPNKEQLQEATIVTLLVCAIITVFVFIIDRAFMFIVETLFNLL